MVEVAGMAAAAPLLELEGVVATYGAVQALRGISLAVQPGEIVALLGANGAGKSTTLRLISGLVRAKSGSVRFAGGDISRTAPERIAKLGIQHVPEGRHVFPGLSVRDNLRLGGTGQRHGRGEIATDLRRMYDLFPVLEKFETSMGWTLSGGQQQMLAIARGLMAHPKLLLLDEPSLGLAPLLVREVFAIVREINARGTTVLLVEQNAFQALKIANRAYVLETGRVVLADDAQRLLNNEQMRSAYLGESRRKEGAAMSATEAAITGGE